MQSAYSSLTRWRRWTLQALLAVTASGCAVGAPQAQTDPTADPPGRVGRLSYVSGPVTLSDLQGETPEAAVTNWPISSQDRLTTGNLGRVEVRIGSTAVRIDSDSVVDFPRIDDETIQIVVQRGSASVRIRNREVLDEIDLLTPRERIAFDDVGRYRIDVDRNTDISSITAFVGQARVESGPLDFTVRSGQRAEVSGHPRPVLQIVAAVPDTFDDWVAGRDRRDDVARSTHYVSPEMTGVESLDEYGEWRVVETYGSVWFPRAVAVGWAPYRHGRWVYVSPWGWTWIDDSPWGFAPFHYGRWVFVGGTWGWVPGVYVARPAYAPALVGWYGSPGVSVTITVGGLVGWYPLGPGEVFVPGYRCSRGYIDRVNHTHVTNIHQVNVISPPAHYRYREPGYSTWVKDDAFRRRDRIHPIVQPPPRDWAHRPFAPRPHVDAPNLAGRKTTMPVPMPRQIVPAQSRPAPQEPVVGTPEARRVGPPERGPRTEHPATPVIRPRAQPDAAPARPTPLPAPAPDAERTRRYAPVVRQPREPAQPVAPRRGDDNPRRRGDDNPPRHGDDNAPRARIVAPRVPSAPPNDAAGTRASPPTAAPAAPVVRTPQPVRTPPVEPRGGESRAAPITRGAPSAPGPDAARDERRSHGRVGGVNVQTR